jgi:WD40 repeat protein
VRFAAGGERAVTADGRRARVWDSASGRLLATLTAATSAAISRDGRFVATIATFGDVTLWDAGDGARLAALGQAANVVFSRDGRLVLTVADDGSATVWETATGRQAAVLPGFGTLVTGVEGAGVFSDFSPGAAFSGDGRLVAVANADGNVRIWDVAARKQVGAVGTGWANAVAFAPRGGLLAVTAWNGELVVAPTPPSVPLRTGTRPSTCVPGFDPILTGDGLHVVAAAAGGAGVWTLAGRRVATLRPPASPPGARNAAAAAVSADGKTVAAASAANFCMQYHRETHGAAVWRLGRAAPVREVEAGVPLGLDGDGRLLAAGGSVWPAAGGPQLPGLGKVLVLSPDGTRALVARAGRVEVALTASGEAVAALGGAARLREELAVDPGAASFSPDGRRLLTRWGLNARLWDATTGDPIALLGRRDEEIAELGFGDGGRLALATFSDRAAVFSAEDGRLLSSVSGEFAGGALSDDGTFAALPGEDGAVEVVDLAAGTRVALQTGTGVRLTDLSFGPGAGLIVARDEAGDVHVVRCEICAPDEELLGLARSRLTVLVRIAAEHPPVGATG